MSLFNEAPTKTVSSNVLVFAELRVNESDIEIVLVNETDTNRNILKVSLIVVVSVIDLLSPIDLLHESLFTIVSLKVRVFPELETRLSDIAIVLVAKARF